MSIPPARIEEAAHNPQLQVLVRDYMKKSLTLENFEFYFSTESNEVQYRKYIADAAPDQVNLSSSDRGPLDHLAQAGRYAEMGPCLHEAKQAIAAMVDRDVLARFSTTPEYKRWWVAKNKHNTDGGLKALTQLKPILKDAKSEAQLKSLMLIVEGGRTPTDRKAAYQAIVKLVKTASKVPTIFKANAIEVPK